MLSPLSPGLLIGVHGPKVGENRSKFVGFGHLCLYCGSIYMSLLPIYSCVGPVGTTYKGSLGQSQVCLVWQSGQKYSYQTPLGLVPDFCLLFALSRLELDLLLNFSYEQRLGLK